MPVCEHLRLERSHCGGVTETSRYDEYVIVHVGKTVGGFAKRFFMFAEVLGQRRPTYIKNPAAGFRHLVSSRLRGRSVCVIVYYDVLAPFVALVRLWFPRVTVVYMVRGDQVSWARFQKRHARARMAHIFQKWMDKLGCVFVFASEDLRSTFTKRLGRLGRAAVLPNTAGHVLPASRPFDGRVAVVGDFGTVKNIEFVLDNLSDGRFEVHLFGNTSLPDKYRRSWLCSHGKVADLPAHLRSCSLVVLSSVTEGFPNVVVEALEAGCAVVAPDRPPFIELPLGPAWRYHMNAGSDHAGHVPERQLSSVLCRILAEQRDFRDENRELYELIESDWAERIWEIFA